jgi:Phosphoadenosine phosphosulfate reductase family
MLATVRQVVAFSGGKDSTATALLLHERGEDFDLLFTPTGNELPALAEHMARVVTHVGKRLITPANRSLEDWIDHYGALPNNRQRWCTRLIKIEPCIAYLKANPGTVLCIGLRADEETRQGLYGEHATYRYPLREAAMGLEATIALCERHNLLPRFRTDCAVCPYQRLIEWHALWVDHRDMWMQGESWENATGYTFRSPSRDSWPASMKAMRERFEAGEVPKRSVAREKACRVCLL